MLTCPSAETPQKSDPNCIDREKSLLTSLKAWIETENHLKIERKKNTQDETNDTILIFGLLHNIRL